MSGNEKLNPCPFCGGEAYLNVSDDEGNMRDEEYEADPWSGLSYMIYHDYEDNKGCPIASYGSDDRGVGVLLYDSREEAAERWNKRI